MSPRIDAAVIFNFHAVNFLNEEKIQEAYDAWECGNDCFTECTAGIIILRKLTKIKMELTALAKSDFCDGWPTQIFNPSKEMVFDLIKDEKQVKTNKKDK